MEDPRCMFKDVYLCGAESLPSLLKKFSQLNHDEYCLSYVFTYRDFAGGNIGLAWTGTPISGGVCSKHGHHLEDGETSHANKSLNTGRVCRIMFKLCSDLLLNHYK